MSNVEHLVKLCFAIRFTDKTHQYEIMIRSRTLKQFHKLFILKKILIKTFFLIILRCFFWTFSDRIMTIFSTCTTIIIFSIMLHCANNRRDHWNKCYYYCIFIDLLQFGTSNFSMSPSHYHNFCINFFFNKGKPAFIQIFLLKIIF